jgi:HAD superfamily hydrolase (TIGR01549 family)
MDGTLTVPNHDFARIKAEMGLRPDTMILEEMLRLERHAPERLVALEAILEKHERRAAETARPQRGAVELVATLHAAGIETALITRNTRRFVDVTLERIGMSFDTVITRDDAEPKPSPAPLHLACERLALFPEETWMVGDFKYDVLAGRAAGCGATVLLETGQHRPFDHDATFVIRELGELWPLIRNFVPTIS